MNNAQVSTTETTLSNPVFWKKAKELHDAAEAAINRYWKEDISGDSLLYMVTEASKVLPECKAYIDFMTTTSYYNHTAYGTDIIQPWDRRRVEVTINHMIVGAFQEYVMPSKGIFTARKQ